MPDPTNDIKDPEVFCHLSGHKPLEGETMRQYLERISPLLDSEARAYRSRTKTRHLDFQILAALALFALAIASGLVVRLFS